MNDKMLLLNVGLATPLEGVISFADNKCSIFIEIKCDFEVLDHNRRIDVEIMISSSTTYVVDPYWRLSGIKLLARLLDAIRVKIKDLIVQKITPFEDCNSFQDHLSRRTLRI